MVNKKGSNDTIDRVLLPLIREKATKRNTDKFVAEVKRFVDKNSDALSHNVPAYRVVFSDSQRDKLFDCYDIDENVVMRVIQTIDTDKAVRKPIGYNYFGKKPFNILSVALIKHYVLAKNNEMVNNIMMNLIFSFYALTHAKYYMYLPNPDIMEYTINRLSNKFLFKQYGSVLKVLQHSVNMNHNAMKETLLSDGDQGALDYLSSMNSRLNNQMNLFSNEYYKDFDAKNIIFKQSDDYGEDDFILTTNLSMNIESKANAAIHQFFTTRVNEGRVRLAAKGCNADATVLMDAIGNIRASNSKQIERVIKDIIITYVTDPRNNAKELGSGKFVAWSIQVYSKSNTKIESVIDLKKGLDEMLNIACSRYHDTTRENTKSNYRKALYVYLVLMIQTSVK